MRCRLHRTVLACAAATLATAGRRCPVFWRCSDTAPRNAALCPALPPLAGAQLMWNSTGTVLLVMSFADFDVTNQSYYGEQKLHYLPADPARADAGEGGCSGAGLGTERACWGRSRVRYLPADPARADAGEGGCSGAGLGTERACWGRSRVRYLPADPARADAGEGGCSGAGLGTERGCWGRSRVRYLPADPARADAGEDGSRDCVLGATGACFGASKVEQQRRSNAPADGRCVRLAMRPGHRVWPSLTAFSERAWTERAVGQCRHNATPTAFTRDPRARSSLRARSGDGGAAQGGPRARRAVVPHGRLLRHGGRLHAR